MSRRELYPTDDEAERFSRRWDRYLRRTAVHVRAERMEGRGTEAWKAAVFHITERVLRMRTWERRFAITILAAHGLNAEIGNEITRRADPRRADDERISDLANREAERLHQSRTEGTG